MAKGSSSIDAPEIGDLSRGAIRRRPADFVDGLRSRRRSRSSGQPIFDATSFGIDAAMLALAAAASVISAPAASLRTDAFSLAVFSVLVLAVFVYLGLYRFSFATHFLEDVRTIIAATAIVAMCMTFGRVLIFDNPDAAAQAVRAWIFASTYVIAVRAGRHIVEMRRRREGIVGQRTLIVGAGAVGRQFADRLMQRPEFGLRPVAFLDDDPLEFDDEEAPPIPVLDSQPVERDGTRFFGPGLQAALEDLQVSHVVVSFSTSSHQAELDLLRRCQARGVTVSVLPRLFEGVTDDLELERIGGIPIVSVRPSDPQGWQYALKYASDRVMAALAIVVVSPIMLVAALATLVTLGRPVLFRQARVGLDGKEFDVLKFRTMRDPEPDERTGLEPGRRGGRGRGARRCRRRRSAHPDRHVPAQELDRRASAAHQRRPRRHVARRPAPGAPDLRAALRRGGLSLRRPPSGQVRDHGLVAGPGAARQHLDRRPGRMGQLLHREPLALARLQDHPDDRPGAAPGLRQAALLTRHGCLRGPRSWAAIHQRA